MHDWAKPEAPFVSQAIPVLHSVLIRGVHSGLLSISGCLIQALRVPIVPVDELCDFFKSDEVRVFKGLQALHSRDAHEQHTTLGPT